MNLVGKIDATRNAISTTLKAITELHNANVDSTTDGCRNLYRLVLTLEDAFDELSKALTIMENFERSL